MKAEFDALERQLDDMPPPPAESADKPREGDPFDDWTQELIAEGWLTEDQARDPTRVEAAYLKRADEQAIAFLKDTLPKLEARLERTRRGCRECRQIATVMAATMIIAAPLLIVFLVFQRQFISSFLHSGLK